VQLETIHLIDIMVEFGELLNQLNEALGKSIGSSRSVRNTTNDTPLVVSSVALLSVLAVQLFTEADPIGKSVRFFRQLSAQVCAFSLFYLKICIFIWAECFYCCIDELGESLDCHCKCK
jgi:hypothetical protein